MTEMTSGRRYAAMMAVWTCAAVTGLTVAVVAVGLLGLWSGFGAVAGIGTTIVGGWIGQVLFATDLDALVAARRAEAEGRGAAS